MRPRSRQAVGEQWILSAGLLAPEAKCHDVGYGATVWVTWPGIAEPT
jgi:hypothetical protein